MKKILLLIILFIAGLSTSFCQTGWLDTTYNSTGMVFTNVGPQSTNYGAMEMQSNDKLLLGSMNQSTGYTELHRYNADGTIDQTFGTSGVVEFTISATINDILVQPDGKILVLGNDRLYRLNSDGSLDNTFDSNGSVYLPLENYGMSLAMQSNGNIVVGTSWHDSWNFTYNCNVLIYSPTGVLQSTATSVSTWTLYSFHVVVQADDKIVGFGSCYEAGYTVFAYRVNSNGTLDNTYNAGTGTWTDYLYSVTFSAGVFLPSGKLLIFSENGTVVRLNVDGTTDTTFGTSGYEYLAYGSQGVERAPNGDLLVVGGYAGNGMSITRYDSNFILDTTFSLDGTVFIDPTTYDEVAHEVRIQSDGKYVVSGSYYLNGYDYYQTFRLNTQCDFPSLATDSHTLCSGESLTWVDGNTYSASNNSATYIMQEAASNGCDSIVTLDLTILPSTNSTDVYATCEPFTWIDGNTYTTSNNTATDTLQSVFGCDSIVTLDLTINTVPTASATDNGDGSITASGNGNYQWIDCANNTPINGATNANFTPSANGNYAVIVDNGNCSDTSACVTINNVSAEEINAFNANIFPNPTKDKITVQFNVPVAELQICDASGRNLITQLIHSGEKIDLSAFDDGVYFISLSDENLATTTRIVKH